MYSYIINITIISNNNYIQNILENLAPKERFQHNFNTVKEPFKDNSQIYIVEDNAKLATELFKSKSAEQIVVLYGDEPTDYNSVDEVWRKPLSNKGLEFYFNNLLDKIKLQKDYALNLNYLDTLIDNSPDLVWFKDIKGSHLKVNKSFCKAVNKTKHQIEGRGHYYIWDITPEEYGTGEYVCLESEDMVIQAAETMVFDEQVKTKAGMRKFLTTKAPIFNEYQQVIGTVGLARDVTDLSNVSKEMDLFIDNIPFGVILSDEEDKILNINTHMEEILGIKKEQYIGTVSNMEYGFNVEVLEDTADKKIAVIEMIEGGSGKILKMTKIHITDVFKNPVGIMRIFVDITDERNLEKQVIHNANTDFLTGLYNRRYFYDYIKSSCLGRAVSVLSIDLDHFKSINDNYGHHVGDEALVLTADVLRQNFADEVVVRNGGDEFIIVLPDSDKENARTRAEMFLRDFNNAFAKRSEFSGVTASLGIASTPCLESNMVDELIKNSDFALYNIKRVHKGGYSVFEG